MLNTSLIVPTKAKADEKNVVVWNCYRVSVLFDRLFRIERSEKGVFRDEATQCVWDRNMAAVKYTLTVRGDIAVIKTNACTLVLKPKRKDCRICLSDGVEREISNAGNLLGTSRTLDGCNGNKIVPFSWLKLPENASDELQLEYGVCARTGVAVLDDSNSLSLAKDGTFTGKKANGSDEYVFAFGNDYRGAVRALYALTGSSPLIPRFAFGNWWSRYHDYSDKEYLRLMEKFQDNDVPLTVATVDMDWHYSKTLDEDFEITKKGRNTSFYGGNSGWTGYTWNKRLFPDYKAFLRELKNRGLRVTLNLHPAEGIRWFEEAYPKMAQALGLDDKSGELIAFDIANPDFVNAYFDILHKPYERDGVDFWWIDWQQGTQSGIDGFDPLWALNHYHFLDHARNHDQPLILSRYAGVGSHRYPIGFSGDTLISWETLDYLPYFTATASNIGYTFWSHDIGGHMFGNVSGELYVRHIQFGVFSPINRLHSSDAAVTTKEPWAYGNGRGKIAMEWLRLRHKLIPFLYTCAHRTHTEGIALIEPLYYEWDTPIAYEMPNEYLFGGQLLVAPITTPMQNGFAKTKAWLPAGTWTDIFTGDEYSALKDKSFEMQRDLESIPVLAKSGAILPFSGDKGNSCANPTLLEVWVYNGNGEFTLYEDGKDKREFFTHFVSLYNENGEVGTQKLTVDCRGDLTVCPPERVLKISFKNIDDGEVCVFIDGKKTQVKEKPCDHVTVEIPFQAEKRYEICVTFKKRSLIEKLLVRAKGILLHAEGDNEGKALAYARLLEAKTLSDYKLQVQLCGMSKEIKQRLLEIL